MASSFFSACGSAENDGAEPCAVDDTIANGPGEERGDFRRRLTGVEFVDGGIGIMNRHAQIAEHRGRGRLAHADRAGQCRERSCCGFPALKFLDKRVAQFIVNLGTAAEPFFESGHGLVEQHAKSVDRLEAACPGRHQQRRRQR